MIRVALFDPLRAPSELQVWDFGDPYGLTLIWRDNANNESGFEIFNGVETRQVGANALHDYYNYRWGGMNPGQYMCFAVRAYQDVPTSGGGTTRFYSDWEPNVSPWYRCGTTVQNPPLNPVNETFLTNLYIGYGVKAQELISVSAKWWVPRVECPPMSNIRPWIFSRAAPWVGLAGKDLFNQDTAWLIQVGTISQCVRGNVVYESFWEIIAPKGEKGTEPQPFKDFQVEANDLISAQVRYDHPTNTFYVELVNVSKGKSASEHGIIPNTTVENSRSYALCIVEQAPEPITPLQGGLAKFATPIEWFECDHQSPPSITQWEVNRFLMGGEKAKISPISHYPYAFTIEWHQW